MGFYVAAGMLTGLRWWAGRRAEDYYLAIIQWVREDFADFRATAPVWYKKS